MWLLPPITFSGGSYGSYGTSRTPVARAVRSLHHRHLPKQRVSGIRSATLAYDCGLSTATVVTASSVSAYTSNSSPTVYVACSYYTAPSGAGVFSAGTQWWICGVDPGCTKPGVDAPAVVRTISAITTRLLDAYAQGLAGGQHPAVYNLQQLHIPGASVPIPAALPNALVPH